MLRRVPGGPRHLYVEWASGRVDSLAVGFSREVDPVELRRLVRELSDSSPQIKRAWLEDSAGCLTYVAEQGRGRQPKGSPIG